MAFCGQCGLLLNTNIVKCPRCGTIADFDASAPEGAPANDNSATVIAHPYTPPPPDTVQSTYPTPGQGTYTYPEPGRVQPPIPQSGNNYPTPNAVTPSSYPTPPGYPTPGYILQGHNQAPTPGAYPPITFASTDPNSPFQPPIPPRKTHTWPIIITILLVLLLLVATSALVFAVGPDRIAGLFGQKNTPIAQVTAGTQPAPTTQPQITPPTPPTPTAQPSPTASTTQQAQATVQQYYDDINAQNYQGAYDLWVNYPDTYANFKQGFAHTHQDAVTFGTITPQTDGTVLVNYTLQATEDAASGTGTQQSNYQGYYVVGQQADGSWKILSAKTSRA